MARLSRPPSLLASPPPRVSAAPVDRQGRDRMRDEQPWRKWYKTARWQRLRWSVLRRDLFTCQKCKRIEPDSSQLVADHKIRHGGEELLFWNIANLWTLCKPCHDSWKQRLERMAGGAL